MKPRDEAQAWGHYILMTGAVTSDMIHPPKNAAPDFSLPEAPARLHLSFLDGIRALAALYVALGHAYLGVFHGPVVPYHFLTNSAWPFPLPGRGS